MEAAEKHLLGKRCKPLGKTHFAQVATPAKRSSPYHLERFGQRNALQVHARRERLACHLDNALGQRDIAHGIVVGERTMSNSRHPFGHDDAFPIA